MVKQEQLIQERLQRLTERMKRLTYNDYMVERVTERVYELQQSGVSCVDRFVQKLLYRIGDKESYLDILTEGRFAIILARMGFSGIRFIKENKKLKLPDIQAKYNKQIVYFEVTRSRPSGDDEAVQRTAAFVAVDKAENIIGKIQGKKGQLQSGEANIVVLWSDTVNLSVPEVSEAFGYIRQEIESNPQGYKDLSGVLFTEGEESGDETLKKFYLFKNDKAARLLGSSLANKLSSLGKQDLDRA